MTDDVSSKRVREEEEGSPVAEEQPPPAKQQRTAGDDADEPPTQSNQKEVEEQTSSVSDACQPEASQVALRGFGAVLSADTETKVEADVAIVVDRSGVVSSEPAAEEAEDASPVKAAMLDTMNAVDEAVVPSNDSTTIEAAEEQTAAPKTDDEQTPTTKSEEAGKAAEGEVAPPAADPAPTTTAIFAIPAIADLPPPEAIAAGETTTAATTTARAEATEARPIVNDPNKVIEEKGEISAEIAGRVIGKGGEVIRDLQARSGASIDVDPAPGASHRIVTYRGTRSKVDFAMHLVDMIARGAPDSDLPLGNATREVLLVPASATGKVIGRGGEMVREMQNRSQAKIDFNHAATASQPDKKQVVVTGTVDAVRKAKEMIMFLVANPMVEAMQALNLLVNEKLGSGTPWGSGGPYPGLPNQGSNIQPEMLGSYGSSGGFGPEATYMAGPPPVAAPYGGRAPPPDNRFGMAEEIFYAKKQYMGRIIGQKGITINDLQKRSGADIQINQDVPPGQDCEIRLRGTRDGVDMVKQMLREVIEIGPGHPYAGGAPNGGGAGGGGGGGFGAPYQQQGGYDYGGQQQPYAYPPQQQQGYPPQQGGYGGPPPSQQYPGYGGHPPQQGGYGGGGGGGPPQQYGGGGGRGGGYAPHAQQPYQAGGYQQGGYQQAPHAAAPQQAYPGGYAQYQRGGGGGYAAPPPASPAAPVWKAAASQDGQTYYYNEATGATQWEKPPGFP
jgi:far upstream element-binding protein